MNMTANDIVNISRPLTELALSQPDTPAIIFPQENRSLSYRQLDEESDCLAHGLGRLGIVAGTRTALLVPPGPELFALTFALFKAGAIPVFIDPGIGARNLKGCLAEAAPEAFIGIPKAHLARRLFGWDKNSLRILVTVGGSSRFWGGVTLAEVRSQGGGSGPFKAAATAWDDTAAILFTSGSTGPPKGAVYTHGNFAAQVAALQELYEIMPGEVDLPTFPLFALFAPALGMTAVIPQMDFTRPGRVEPERILGPAASYAATTMFGSPALLNRVGRCSAPQGAKLSSLKRVISAGAPVSAEVLERFSALLPQDAEIFTPYGATEALPVSSIGSREILAETGHLTGEGRGVCVGRPVPSIDLAIIPISDEPIADWCEDLALPPWEVGEIVVSGPQVTASYFNRPEATRLAKIADPEGGVWHRMGDVGYRDNTGRIWFCGRKSHRVVSPAETLFTIPVEGVFNVHPLVFRTALVGVGKKGSQRPVLCVELEKGTKKSEQALVRRDLLERAALYPHTKGIRDILFHPAFPVDIRHNAKIFREKLAIWAAGKIR